MTTIILKDDIALPKQTFENAHELIEAITEALGYKIMWPITDKKFTTNEKQKHQR